MFAAVLLLATASRLLLEPQVTRVGFRTNTSFGSEKSNCRQVNNYRSERPQGALKTTFGCGLHLFCLHTFGCHISHIISSGITVFAGLSLKKTCISILIQDTFIRDPWNILEI